MSSGYQEPAGGTASPSSGTAVGSKPIRAWLKVLRNVDIVAEPGYGSTFIPKIKTPFEILSTALRIQNPAQTFYTNIESAALVANQSIKVPIITATESGNKKDELVFLKQAQSLENKTFPTYYDVTETAAPANPSAGTLRIYANSTTHELTQRDSAGTEVKLSDGTGGGGGGAPTDAQYLTLGVNVGLTNERVLTGSSRISITDAGPGVTATLDIGTGSIVDSQIGSHTSTKISITAKGQLNSAILYSDVDNTLGSHYVDITERAAPSNPSAGVLRIYANSTTHELTQRDSSGTEKKFSDGSGGSGAPTNVSYLTLASDATLTSERVATASSRVTITDAGANSTATFDIGSGSIVDSYIGSHTSTKITITAKGQLNSAILYGDTNQDLGAFYHDIGEISAPSAPAANKLRIYMDSSDESLRVKNSGNTVFNLFSPTGLVDANIGTHTSTKISITAKGQLNSQIAYKDENTWLTDAMVSGSAAIGWSKISKTGSIYDDIADVTITSAAAQDIIQRNSGNTAWINLVKGSNNTMLGINGSGVLAYSTVADANIASHTSTKITITSKGQLNSNILYGDQNNSFGAFYHDITEIAAPANPSAGTLRIYANSTTHELTQRDSSGTEKKFSDGSGGSGAPTNVPYLTLASDATLTAERVATASTRVTITDAGANSTATFDIGSGSIVDAYIGTHTSTKISITAKGQLNSQIAYKDETLWLTNAMVSGSAAISQTKIAPVHPADFLYKIYIDTGDSNKYKAFNYDTNVVTDSGSSTDVLSLFNSIIDAASTAKRAVSMGKGYFKFSDEPTIAAKWIRVKGTRFPHSGGSKGDPNNETVLKKNFTETTLPFFKHDGSSTWTQQIWEDIVIEGKDSNNNGTGTWDDTGIGFQAISTGTAISEIYDYMTNVTICHFGTGLYLGKCYQLTFEALSIYKCGTKGIYLTGDGVDSGSQCVEIQFRNSEVRFAPTNLHVDKATHTRWNDGLLEGDNNSPYTQVNSAKIETTGYDTRIRNTTFENNVVGPVTQILNNGICTVIDSCRFGGLAWTAQTIYSGTGQKGAVINNAIEPYTDNAVATITLSSGAKDMMVVGNHVQQSATNTSLVITDSSGNPLTNTIGPNSSGASMLGNTMGPANTYLSPMTLKSTGYLDIEERSAPSAPSANFLRMYMDSGDESLRVKNSSNTVFNLFSPTGLVDANIGSHTSTKITITAKGQLNSAILYSDVDNALGAHYFDIDEIAAPGNPAAGKLRIFANTATGELSQKNSSGTVVKLSDGSGGGGITASSADTLTNKKISGLLLNFNAKTANYTATRDDDYIPCDATSGTVTISLPTAVGVSGKMYTVRKTDSSANTVIIDPNSTETIAGASTFTLTRQHQQIEFYSDNANWLNEDRVYINPQIDMDAATTWRWGSSLQSSMVFQTNGIWNLTGIGGLLGVLIDPNGTTGDGFQLWDADYSNRYNIATDDIAGSYKIRLPKITQDDFFVSRKTAVEIAGNPIYKRWGGYQPMAPSTVSGANVGRLEGILTNHVPTGAGTNTNTWDTTEGLLANLVTTSTANQNAGLVSPTGSIGMFRREQAAKLVYRGKIDTVAGGVARLYFGVSSNNALPTSDTPVANADSAVIVGFKSTATNYEIYANDGSGPHSTTAFDTPVAKNTSFHTIEMEWTASGNIICTLDGQSKTISTDFPAAATNLFFHCSAQNATAAIRTHSIVGVWVEGI